MAKLDLNQNRYYPSPQRVGDLHDDFRRVYDLAYSLQDQVRDLHGRLSDAHQQMATMRAQHESAIAKLQNPANTRMLGLKVRPTDLKNGQVLTYVSATGDFVFM